MRAPLAFAVALAILGLSGEARSDDASAAQALFDQAVAEMKAQKYASACRKLEEVKRILPDALGAQVELANCYEKEGRLASAWAEWSRVQALSTAAGQSKRAERAAARSRALTPQLSRLTVRLAPEVSALTGVVVQRDGTALGPPQWGLAIPVDGGAHDVEVTAPGYLPFHARVEVARSKGDTVVDVPALTSEGAPSPAPESTPAPPPASSGAASDAATWQKPVSRALIGVGAAGVVTGVVLGALALSNNSRSNDDGCNATTNECTSASGVELRSKALGFATGSTIAFIAGGVLAGAGIVLWITEPKGLHVNVAGSNVTLQGTF